MELLIITKHGIVYHAYFIDFSNYHPAFDNVYTFNIEPENDNPKSLEFVSAFYDLVKNGFYGSPAKVCVKHKYSLV